MALHTAIPTAADIANSLIFIITVSCVLLSGCHRWMLASTNLSLRNLETGVRSCHCETLLHNGGAQIWVGGPSATISNLQVVTCKTPHYDRPTLSTHCACETKLTPVLVSATKQKAKQAVKQKTSYFSNRCHTVWRRTTYSE